jgi:hypothetical protein
MNNSRWNVRLRFFKVSCLCIFSVISSVGCGGKSLSKAQVDRIKLGQSVTEVEEILGKGNAVDAGETDRLVKSSLEPSQSGAQAGGKIEIDSSELRGVRWGNEKKSVTVIFRNDRVFRVFPQGLEK